MVDDVEPVRLEAIEDAHATEPGGAQLVSQASADGLAQRPSLAKQLARPRHEVAKCGLPAGRDPAFGEIAFAGAVSCPDFRRHIDAAAVAVDLQVLPEVGQLQGSADAVGPLV